MLKEKSECVKVIERCRPLSKGKVKDGNKCVITVEFETALIFVAKAANGKDRKLLVSIIHTIESKIFLISLLKFQIYPGNHPHPDCPTNYQKCQGYNETIFAYGQTGPGKTFRMEGCETDDFRGIFLRTINRIFEKIKNYTDKQFLVRVSFVEIYNEEVRDLLNKNLKHKRNVREKEGVFYVEDCKILKGKVISKPVSNKNHFVPYRESKLTMLLQDSLGGNTKTVMIAMWDQHTIIITKPSIIFGMPTMQKK